MKPLIRYASQECTAMVMLAADIAEMALADEPVAPLPVQTGVVGFVGLDPFDRTMHGEAERLGLAAAGRLRTEALLLFRAPPSRCNAEAVPF